MLLLVSKITNCHGDCDPFNAGQRFWTFTWNFIVILGGTVLYVQEIPFGNSVKMKPS